MKWKGRDGEREGERLGERMALLFLPGDHSRDFFFSSSYLSVSWEREKVRAENTGWTANIGVGRSIVTFNAVQESTNPFSFNLLPKNRFIENRTSKRHKQVRISD